MVAGEPSVHYNCVAWSVGKTKQWLWPGNTLAHFDSFYNGLGYERAHDGPLALWGYDTSQITHVSVLTDNGLRWESKCGADLRIQHHLNEFNGHTYGKVLAFYKPGLQDATNTQQFIQPSSEAFQKLNNEEAELLKKLVKAVPKKIILEFEKIFEAWRNSWFAGRLAINSNPYNRTNSYEFFKLVKMGECILPLVVNKLTERENFFALQLYERLQHNRRLIVEHNLSDPDFLQGEQGRVFKNVSKYIENVLSLA